MDYQESIDCKARCVAVLFKSKDGSFMIGKFLKTQGDAPVEFTMKGNFYFEKGIEYTIKAKNSGDKRYPESYDPLAVIQFNDLLNADKTEQKKFLKMALSESNIKALYSVTDNPIKVLEEGDIRTLSKANGIGDKKALRLIELYENQKDYSAAYAVFSEYKLNPEQVKAICKGFGGVEQAIGRFKDNPYILTTLTGYGFKRADAIFLSKKGNKPNDPRRVKAYIKYMFDEMEAEGHSWISGVEFAKNIKEAIYDVNLKQAVDYVKEHEDYEVYKFDDELRISLSQTIKNEREIVKEINRLINGKSDVTKQLMENADIVKQVQVEQGWKFDKDQQIAIKRMITENVFLLQGYGGSGKSSTLNAVTSIANKAGLVINQCALSGKAANNMFLVTKRKATTIHTMLGYGPNGFVFNAKNKLPADIVVIDEGSMVDMYMFLSVLRAIKDGAKLIILGDMGQLESIGIGIMGELIDSRKFPEKLLTTIHRQAQKSAIVTHSISIRNGKKPKELKIVEGSNIYGELEDLEYIFVDSEDSNKIPLYAMNKFRELIQEHDINDVQMLCSTKASGQTSTWDLNKFAQRVLLNNKILEGGHFTIKRQGYKKPKDDVILTLNKNGNDDNSEYLIHVGEKVINMRNNKETKSTTGLDRPIFNGNTGVVKSLNDYGEDIYMVIDFEGIGEVAVPEEHFKFIELGYAITTHKSQGSTIPYVILVFPFHYLLNTRESLYTGITRASKHLTLITTPKSFKYAIKNTDVKKKRGNFANLFNRPSDFKVIK